MLSHKGPLFFLLFLFTTGAVICLRAAPGDLDRTFSADGRVWPLMAYAGSIAIQSDGKIVTAGGVQGQFVLARYSVSGSLDNSFGVNGIVSIDFGDPGCFATSLTIQSDGRIIAAGYSGYGSNYRFALARFDSSGSLDLSFDGDGKVTTTIGADDLALSVALQVDGKIVAAGKGGGEYPNGYGVIVRYNLDGSLDASFDGDGKLTTPAAFGHSTFSSVVIQGDDRIIAAGTGNYSSIGVVRYTANGTLDPTFGQGGRALFYVDVGLGENYGNAVALQPDGKIVVAGSAMDFDGFHFEAVVARLSPTGSLDSSFGSGGIVTTQTGQYCWLNGLAIQPNGKIVVAGAGNVNEFLVMRYNSNGSLDSSYGTGGKVFVDFWGQSGASGVALDSIGRAVVSGTGIARLLGDIAAPLPPEFDFDGDGKSDISVFRPSNSVWYLNRSTDGFSATPFGISTDDLAPADYDGDGRTDVGVFRGGAWWRINSASNTVAVDQFGVAGDISVPADYTGDGRDELAVYRSGEWWAIDLTNDQATLTHFGLAGDKPVAADYDGDGKADQAVYRNGEWHLNLSSQGYTVLQFGLPTDIPLPADFDGDGKADLAVYRNGVWYLSRSRDGFAAIQFGLSTDIPVPADYDGDGKADQAIYRDGVWWVLRSSGGITTTEFGLGSDTPVPSAYLP